MAMFVLTATEHVNKDKAQLYETMGIAIDKKIEEVEPGMLVHGFEKVSEDDKEVVYRWLEVFRDYEDFETHINSVHVKEHHEKLNEENAFAAPIDVAIYSDWTEEQKAPWRRDIPGITITFVPLLGAYFRSL